MVLRIFITQRYPNQVITQRYPNQVEKATFSPEVFWYKHTPPGQSLISLRRFEGLALFFFNKSKLYNKNCSPGRASSNRQTAWKQMNNTKNWSPVQLTSYKKICCAPVTWPRHTAQCARASMRAPAQSMQNCKTARPQDQHSQCVPPTRHGATRNEMAERHARTQVPMAIVNKPHTAPLRPPSLFIHGMHELMKQARPSNTRL